MTKVEISTKTILSILLLGAVFFIFSRTADIVIQVFVAFVLMTALNPLVNRLQRLHMSRGMAIGTTYVMVISTIVVVLAVIVPALVDQTVKLLTQLNLPEQPLLARFSGLQLTSSQLIPLVSQYSGSVGKVFNVIFSTFSTVFTIFTVLVMALYFLLGRDHLYTYTTVFFRSGDKKERSKQMIDRVEKAVGSWVRGEFILMVIIGVMAFVGLTILNIPYALPLAILAGLTEAFPNIGPTLSAIPAIIIALISVSPLMAGVTGILFILIHQLENSFITPQVMKHATGVRPLTVIVVILLGFRFGGVMGALLAVPTFIVIREVLAELSPEITSVSSGE